MSLFLSIEAQQRPFEISLSDANKRSMFSANYQCMTDGISLNLDDELKTHLVNGGLSLVFGTNLFTGLKTPLPTSDGPYVRMIITSGIAPSTDHNNNDTDMPGFQILVEGIDYEETRNLANNIYTFLHSTINSNLVA